MTCIVGLTHEGVTWLGGDCAGVGGTTVFRGRTLKVFNQGPYAIGFAGSYNLAQSIQGLDLPKPPLVEDVAPFMQVTFSAFLKDQVYVNEEEAALLVGIRGQLFELDAYFGVFEGRHPFNAIGSASDFALGALLMVNGEPLDPPQGRIRRALAVAHDLSPGCCQPPFTIIRDR